MILCTDLNKIWLSVVFTETEAFVVWMWALWFHVLQLSDSKYSETAKLWNIITIQNDFFNIIWSGGKAISSAGITPAINYIWPSTASQYNWMNIVFFLCFKASYFFICVTINMSSSLTRIYRALSICLKSNMTQKQLIKSPYNQSFKICC